ncbi:hypothetical protein RXV95_13035 [Novosphingobium sp. ZN18A2]|uniref:hypothetical protein n=1 Tax=Novosphingobium sp. ZN18A2 TaxID=3079861 RepID=UPI0030D4472A
MPYAIDAGSLSEFQCRLIGTWKNDPDLLVDGRPPSFNVMPLPQVETQPSRPAGSQYGGFILKNFSFNEIIRFNGSIMTADPAEHIDTGALAVVAGAPNRGGTYTQTSHAVFYDQLVFVADGPDKDKVIHVENGAWLHFGSAQQLVGPYGPDAYPGPVLRQPSYVTVAKQISVPHGNSVLALGSVDLNDRDHFNSSLTDHGSKFIFRGKPELPDAPVPYPAPADQASAPYCDAYAVQLGDEANPGAGEYENPLPSWTLNPNYPLQAGIDILKPRYFIHWRVTTEPLLGDKGHVTNVPFEQRKSEVTAYWADYWLLSHDADSFDYLAYSQTIIMEMDLLVKDRNGDESFQRFVFPHVTTNIVKKVSGNPSQARQATPAPLQ